MFIKQLKPEVYNIILNPPIPKLSQFSTIKLLCKKQILNTENNTL